MIFDRKQTEFWKLNTKLVRESLAKGQQVRGIIEQLIELFLILWKSTISRRNRQKLRIILNLHTLVDARILAELY